MLYIYLKNLYCCYALSVKKKDNKQQIEKLVDS